jgi:hypothetical protein
LNKLKVVILETKVGKFLTDVTLQVNNFLEHSLFTSPYLESWHHANLYALMIKFTLQGCSDVTVASKT